MKTTQRATGGEHDGVALRQKTIVASEPRRAAVFSPRNWAAGGMLLMMLVVGCARVPTVRAPAAEPAVTSTTRAPASPISSDATEAAIDITSEPAGATILVNDRPSGKTPLRLAVKTTPQGFCADYLTIKARFIASDASQVSQTTEADLTPREKAPRELVFTPQGVKRHLR
jgi:hypothetical protein